MNWNLLMIQTVQQELLLAYPLLKAQKLAGSLFLIICMAGLKKRSAKCSKLLTESLYGDSVFYLSLIKTHIYSVIILKNNNKGGK